MQEEFEREKEALFDDARRLHKELGLQAFIIDSYIPKEYQELIGQHTMWDEDTGEWHMVRVTHIEAYICTCRY